MSNLASVEEGETPQCHSCSAELPLEKLKDFSDSYGGAFGPHTDKGPFNLCELCASTFAGNSVAYPDQYGYSGKILQAICFVGNKILRRIDEIEGCD